jgi:hypothetical protein
MRPIRLITSMLALSLVAACGSDSSQAEVDPPATAAPTTVMEDQPETGAATPTTQTTATTIAATTTTAVSQLSSISFEIPFEITGESAAAFSIEAHGDGFIDLHSKEFADSFLVVTTVGPEAGFREEEPTIEWLDWLTTHPQITTSDPTAIEIGGLEATSIQIEVAEEMAFFHNPGGGIWYASVGFPQRVYLLEVGDAELALFADSPAARFEGFIGQVESAFADWEWTG